ncbi:hypothetical protein [Lentibacillus cibarius]|uniref:Uncharacterized protein n=1 Tax=Lentibacillus cibarius TaxID=2583219 RepID=A0A5S3R7I2_9BACI|nr:hypothetical protein [Lentibacillus cibarius]TMN21853.1 hypothetical protein FFL34_06795 [Lentibacillus cibarius]
MKNIRENEDFIKKVVFYYARDIGKAANRIEVLSVDELLKAYMVPSKSYLEAVMTDQIEGKEENLAVFATGSQNLIDYTQSVLEFFNDYRFFYNQYKHGLTVALRPFSGTLNKNELHRRKTSLDGLPISYDNETIEKAFKSKQEAFVIPNLTPEIQPGITKLQEERNLLRYRYGELIDINDLINIGKQVHSLIRTLIKNRVDYIVPELEEGNTFYLPIPKKKDAFRFAKITTVPLESKLTLKDFSFRI